MSFWESEFQATIEVARSSNARSAGLRMIATRTRPDRDLRIRATFRFVPTAAESRFTAMISACALVAMASNRAQRARAQRMRRNGVLN